MITTVTLNPAIDHSITLEHFHYGAVNRSLSSREDMGGKGINVARVLTALGLDAKAVGFMGRDNYCQTQSLLVKESIWSEFIPVSGTTRTNIKLMDKNTQTTTDINEVGFTVQSQDLFSLRELLVDLAQSSSYMVFSGSIPLGMSSTIYKDLMSQLPPNCRPVLDADGAVLLEGLKAKPFLIKPNIHELEDALGQHLSSHQEIAQAGQNLLQQYGITYVLVSMGDRGSLLVSNQEALFAQPLSVDLKSTVGAGDSMLAGFLYGLEQQGNSASALAWGVACGTLAVSQEGTQAFGRAEAEKLVPQVQIVPVAV